MKIKQPKKKTSAQTKVFFNHYQILRGNMNNNCDNNSTLKPKFQVVSFDEAWEIISEENLIEIARRQGGKEEDVESIIL